VVHGTIGELFAGRSWSPRPKGSRRFLFSVRLVATLEQWSEMNKTSKGGRPATNEREAATFGEFLSDGTLIEIICPDARPKALSLLVWKEGVLAETRRARRDAVSYVPGEPDTSILRAMYIPSGVSEYDTTGSLFTEIIDIFRSRADLSRITATLMTHFVFSTWFADCLSSAPRLLVYGPPEESATLLQLLAATCRRALLLSDVNMATWSNVLTALRPTLIINTRRLQASTRAFLEASKMRNQYVPRKGQLLDLFAAQVIHEGIPSGAQSIYESAICLTVTPARGKLPILTDQNRIQIANQIQRKLLLYRLRHYTNVRDSDFDVPEFTAGVRSQARTWGACIVDDPELQSRLIAALRGADDDARTALSFSPESVLVEALLLLCHEKPTRAAATVGKIAEKMNVIFQGRGEPLELEPRKVGDVLRALQFSTRPQGSAARGIALLVADRRRIHQLAHDFDVPTIHDGVVDCPQCEAAEIAKTAGGSFS
jgi:hypothetical protein